MTYLEQEKQFYLKKRNECTQIIFDLENENDEIQEDRDKTKKLCEKYRETKEIYQHDHKRKIFSTILITMPITFMIPGIGVFSPIASIILLPFFLKERKTWISKKQNFKKKFNESYSETSYYDSKQNTYLYEILLETYNDFFEKGDKRINVIGKSRDLYEQKIDKIDHKILGEEALKEASLLLESRKKLWSFPELKAIDFEQEQLTEETLSRVSQKVKKKVRKEEIKYD